MRILICGSRDWSNWDKIRQYLRTLDKDTVIIEGDARGADKMSGYLAEKEFGFKVVKFPADWNKYDKAAGPIRNQQMITEGKPDKAVAFWDGESRGTADMIKRLESAKIPVDIIK